ncbi:alpha/beta fold hydrolase [Pseudolysinimonas sp.]|uniref:alpha/beta fold hydrolase n=1 Tax=Pseudolysinimonas sp. TaxID=2680009 RepID=UPI003F81C069
MTDDDAARPLTPLDLGDGRTILVDDSGPSTREDPALFWHHGSPHTGALYEPLLGIARERGLRIVAVARPGYGGSEPRPGRTVADSARDALEAADRLGLGRLLALGASGGGPHALAMAALAEPGRMVGVVAQASPAPFDGTDAWWRGMADDGGLRVAVRGRDARLAHAETDEFDPASFVDTDYAALEGEWAALGRDAGVHAAAFGPVGLVDDDVAFTHPWGVELARIAAPVVLLQGARDRVIPPAHAQLIAAAVADAEVRIDHAAGHVAALGGLPAAIDAVLARMGG